MTTNPGPNSNGRTREHRVDLPALLDLMLEEVHDRVADLLALHMILALEVDQGVERRIVGGRTIRTSCS
jgi:hypothetical protein